jgi:23S rRNA pseudouridine1911/1915/1917 synthase
MDLDVRYEDDSLVVVDKPQGLVVHPAPGHPTGTLVNGLLHGRTTAGGDPLRPGIVHRLDKDTSGLIVVAKDDRAHAGLARQFQEHTIDRRYQVLVCGAPPDDGVWSTLHGRSPRDRKRFSSRVTKGRRAVSRFAVVERFAGAALLRVTLETGRTHQVRVHCSDHGFPVLGDPCYGPRRITAQIREIHNQLPGQALHAELLGFDHPITGARVELTSAPPLAFQHALRSLRAISP